MGIFRDEYGDVVVWRVALAALVLAAVAAVAAVAAFGPREATGDQADERVELPAPASEGTAGTALDAWLARTEGSDGLAGIPRDDLEGLMAAAVAWQESIGGGDATVTVEGEPLATESDLAVALRAEGREGTSTAVATLAPDGTWHVAEAAGEDAKAGGRVAISDVAALSGHMGEEVASEVSRQVAASGIEGAGEALTTPSSVSADDGVTSLRIWFPSEDGRDAAWDASFDQGFGMLEIAPADSPEPSPAPEEAGE